MVEDDRTLLEAARAGDQDALEALLLRHQDRIYRFGMKLCQHPEDAEDVLQDTLLAMTKSVHDFEGRSSLSTWLYSVARSFCLKKRRKSKFAPKHIDSLESDVTSQMEPAADPAAVPEEALAEKELHVALRQAIAKLEPDQREVLVLRDVEGLSAKEVGEVLDLSVAAVKSRLHRARLKLRERMLGALEVDQAVRDGCPDIVTLYSRHLEGEISTTMCDEMNLHIQTCPKCGARCDSLKKTLALCKSAGQETVPVRVQDSVRAALKDFLATER